MKKIGAAYIRVSDERQDEYSPDSQLKKIREDASKDGYTIPDEYVFYDDGISGRSVKKRNDFNRMIAIAKDKSHPFDRIYVWKFSRFARNQEESLVYKNLLKKKDVSVKSVSETIPEGIYGSLIERIIEWMDEFYSINLSTEVQRGFAEKISRGEPTCNAPYGYEMKDKKYYPHKTESKVIKEIFERFARGEKQRAIAISLNAKGVRTRQGKQTENRWVDYILNNPVYIGKLRLSKDNLRAVSKRDYTNENIIVADGIHEPIISMELWETVQAKLKQQKRNYPKHSRQDQPVDYMLKGLVRCSNCNSTLAATAIAKKSVNRSVQCCNYSRGSCKESHSITLPKLEEAFLLGLKEAIGNQSFLIEPKKVEPTQNDVNYDQLIYLEQRRLERIREAYINEVDTLEQYKENKAKIEAKIDSLMSAKDRVETPKFDASNLAKKVENVYEFLLNPTISAKAKNEMLHTIIDKIIYDKKGSHLAIYFKP